LASGLFSSFTCGGGGLSTATSMTTAATNQPS
jgi:hypothetical protein